MNTVLFELELPGQFVEIRGFLSLTWGKSVPAWFKDLFNQNFLRNDFRVDKNRKSNSFGSCEILKSRTDIYFK